MTCIACEEARRVALAFYDRMAANIRKRVRPVRPVPPKINPAKYRDRPWHGANKGGKP